MKSRILLAGIACLTLVGCQRSAPAPTFVQAPAPPPVSAPPPASSGPLVWGRLDCKRASTNPEIVEAFNTDKAMCERSAGIKEGDGVTATLEACMSERGYRYRAKDEHDAYCRSSQRSAARR